MERVVSINFAEGRGRTRLTMTVVTGEEGLGTAAAAFLHWPWIRDWSAPVSRDRFGSSFLCLVFFLFTTRLSVTNVSVAPSKCYRDDLFIFLS